MIVGRLELGRAFCANGQSLGLDTVVHWKLYKISPRI